MKEARLQTAVRKGETLSQDRFAELMGAVLGRVMHPTQYRRYEAGESDPPYEVVVAAAQLSGLTAAYIAFGSEPLPPIDASQLRYLTDEELDRAAKKVAEESSPTPSRRAAGKGARKPRA